MAKIGQADVSALIDDQGKPWPIHWSQPGLQTVLEATSPYDGQTHRLRLDDDTVFDDESMLPQPEFNLGFQFS